MTPKLTQPLKCTAERRTMRRITANTSQVWLMRDVVDIDEKWLWEMRGAGYMVRQEFLQCRRTEDGEVQVTMPHPLAMTPHQTRSRGEWLLRAATDAEKKSSR